MTRADILRDLATLENLCREQQDPALLYWVPVHRMS
jgi:hypothetical protein